jgi:hypothetical protein
MDVLTWLFWRLWVIQTMTIGKPSPPGAAAAGCALPSVAEPAAAGIGQGGGEADCGGDRRRWRGEIRGSSATFSNDAT